SATNAGGSLIVAEVGDGPHAQSLGDQRELLTAFHDGSTWSSRGLGPIQSATGVAFGGDKFAVVYWPASGGSRQMEIRENGAWRTQLPAPENPVALVGNGTHLLSVSNFSRLSFWNGNTWGNTGSTTGATSLVTPAAAAGEAGFGVLFGTWESGYSGQTTYGIDATVFDGTTWRRSTLT